MVERVMGVEPSRKKQRKAFAAVVEPDAGKKTVLVTGGAGFIGSHTAQALLSRGDSVVVLDNFNDYYDPSIKRGNVELLEQMAEGAEGSLVIVDGSITDAALVGKVFQENSITHVCHLAARAGVRPSIEDPLLYVGEEARARARRRGSASAEARQRGRGGEAARAKRARRRTPLRRGASEQAQKRAPRGAASTTLRPASLILLYSLRSQVRRDEHHRDHDSARDCEVAQGPQLRLRLLLQRLRRQ
jgi:hypothetical protein